MNDAAEFYDQSALLYRLGDAIQSRPREIVFLLGSPLSAPEQNGARGVPTVNGVIQLIAAEFSQDTNQRQQLEQALRGSSNPYQSAFKFLIGRKGQDVANEIVQRAVLGARLHKDTSPPVPLSDEHCRALEADHAGWHLPPGLTAIGSLITKFPKVFGGRLLTTNFDPCIQQAIDKAGGRSWRTTLHGDGSLSQTEADGCHVIHLHGYWYGSDTLHTVRQLTQARPKLNSSLTDLLRNKMLVISGYGGWDDVSTRAIFEVIGDDLAAPEVLWLFKSLEPQIPAYLAGQLDIGVGRGRLALYEGIDCNTFFPELEDFWINSGAVQASTIAVRTNQVIIPSTLQATLSDQQDQRRQIEGDTEDRPPEFSICVGRDEELALLTESLANVIFITGIGGQGKSTLAAQYFQNYRKLHGERLVIWRDCKEVSETFENQLISAIEGLSEGRVNAGDLARQSTETIVDLLVGMITKRPVLFVFDNVDSFVRLDRGIMTSSADLLVKKMLSTPTSSQLVFTCRPQIDYSRERLLSLHLEGISLEATNELFKFRQAVATELEIGAAHAFTGGHSLWLDLLAIQTGRPQNPQSLTKLLTAIGDLPENTLDNIWSRLKDNEQFVLQMIAETVKPTSENDIGEYLSGWMHFHKCVKAIRSLKAQNLVVVKELKNKTEVLELHPLIRQFVRTRFPLTERQSFMRAIIRVYTRTIAKYIDYLGDHPSFIILQNWTEKAQLDAATGDLGGAFETLAQASSAFAATGFTREFTRSVRILLDSFDWTADHGRFRSFDSVFGVHLECLSYLGDTDEVDILLDKFALTVPERDLRYVTYCELKCFTKWIRRQFGDAVAWGKIGVSLLDKTKADSHASIRHRLALAQRDAGSPEIALDVFLSGTPLTEVTDPDELIEERGGSFYGNIGRCLHLMGQFEQALICYQKSSLVLEKNLSQEHVLNQGYIRWWIGELLLARGQKELASNFIEAARRKWDESAPGLAKQLTALRAGLADALGAAPAQDIPVERICRAWITGAYLDV